MLFDFGLEIRNNLFISGSKDGFFCISVVGGFGSLVYFVCGVVGFDVYDVSISVDSIVV